jgi:hypothetical protein
MVLAQGTSAESLSDIAHVAYEALAPLRDGEAILDPLGGTCWYLAGNGLPERVGLSDWTASHDVLLADGIAAGGFLRDADANAPMIGCVLSESAPVSFPALRDSVYSATWLGEPGPPRRLATAAYRVEVGAGTFTLCPKHFEMVCSFEDECAYFAVARTTDEPSEAVSLRIPSAIDASQAMPLAIKDLARAAGVDQRLLYGCEARAALRAVAYKSTDEPAFPWTPRRVREHFAALAAGVEPLRVELENVFRDAHERTRGRLQERLQHAIQRPRLVPTRNGRGRPAIFTPSNEMETIWLAARLEGAIAEHVWPEFKLLEYTPRDGIDAVAECRLDRLGLTRPHAIEFEFELRNFFRHAHPIHQVDAIICWTAGIADGAYRAADLGALGAGEMQVTLLSSDRAKTLNFGSHVIAVLCLRDLVSRLDYE